MGLPLLEKIQISGVVGGTEPIEIPVEEMILRQSLLIELPPNQRLQFNRLRWNLLTEDLPITIMLEFVSDPDIGSNAIIASASQGDTDTFLPPFYNSTMSPVNMFVNVYLRNPLDLPVNVLPNGSTWWVSLSRLAGPGP